MSRDEQEPTGSPWTRPWFIASACAVGVLVVVGILLAVLPGRNTPPGDASSPHNPSTSLAPSAAASDSVCGLEAGSQTIPAGPIKAQWTLLGRVEAPHSASLGPGVTDADGWRYCYAHSPAGAVVAAANILAIGQHPDFPRRLATEIYTGPGREAFIAEAEALSDEELRNQLDQLPVVTVGGFRVASYDSTMATLDLLLRAPDGALTSATWRLAWEDGDWRFWAPESDRDIPMQRVADSTGFIEWSAP